MVEQKNDSRAAVLEGGVSHPSQLTTGLVIKSVTTSPTLAGERMLFILQVSILSEQTGNLGTINDRSTHKSKKRRHRAVALMAPKTGMTGNGCGRRTSQWKGSNKGG